ncbi:MAG: hypothetical protein COB26_10535 [Piscirickettsiaceae bacterium]|nr:MAG: hypothetical protein COB26_10535 [Piscirickettsiaceae bacterium]
MIFKPLMLQNWRKFSDPAPEKQLAQDLLFHRVTGLDISKSVPDHSTFLRFRQTLERLCLMDGFLNEITASLAYPALRTPSLQPLSL